jgi:methylated-DNA-[protein]-cysteine S-methyltransferase
MLFVPCHRILASSGLGGYAYGLDLKKALLQHEGFALD